MIIRNYNNIGFIVLVATSLLGIMFFLSLYSSHHYNIQGVNSVQDLGNSLVATSSPIPVALASSAIFSKKNSDTLLWGAYVGDGVNNLTDFETLVGKKMNLYPDFEGWTNNFPLGLSSKVGQQGKTLIIFWEPSFGYDKIIDGSQDTYIKQFATDAKKYSYPIILVPFDEMNLSGEPWGYDQNNNNASKFILAWRHVHDLFAEDSNVKFGLDYNSVSTPLVKGNLFSDYYPGNSYVDYVGVVGFNYSVYWRSFGEIFDSSMSQLSSYNKPIIIFSVASEADPRKAAWITEGLNSHIKSYKNIAGFVWFNQGGSPNWLVNSDGSSLRAFEQVLP